MYGIKIDRLQCIAFFCSMGPSVSTFICLYLETFNGRLRVEGYGPKASIICISECMKSKCAGSIVTTCVVRISMCDDLLKVGVQGRRKTDQQCRILEPIIHEATMNHQKLLVTLV